MWYEVDMTEDDLSKLEEAHKPSICSNWPDSYVNLDRETFNLLIEAARLSTKLQQENEKLAKFGADVSAVEGCTAIKLEKALKDMELWKQRAEIAEECCRSISKNTSVGGYDY